MTLDICDAGTCSQGRPRNTAVYGPNDHSEVGGMIDEGTTCRLLADCLKTMKGWSDANPAHQPIFVQIEPKDAFDEATDLALDVPEDAHCRRRREPSSPA